MSGLDTDNKGKVILSVQEPVNISGQEALNCQESRMPLINQILFILSYLNNFRITYKPSQVFGDIGLVPGF